MTKIDDMVPKEVSELLHRLERDWSAPLVPQRVITHFEWGGQDLTSIARLLSVDGDNLDITLTVAEQAGAGKTRQSVSLQPFMDLWAQGVNGRTEDGLLFTAANAVPTRTSLDIESDVPERTTRVQASHWVLHNPDAPPTLWVGEIHAPIPEGMGNLTLRSTRKTGQPGAFSRGHFRFKGAKHTYYLIVRRARGPRPASALLAVEKGSGHLDPLEVAEEVDLIGFALGVPFKINHFFGVDEDVRLLGLLAGNFGEAPSRNRPDPLVPITNSERSWAPSFFAKLAQHTAATPVQQRASLRTARWYYLSAFGESAGNAFVAKMFLAVAAAARQRLGGAPLVVESEESWRSWVQAHEAEIAPLAAPEMAKQLLAAVSDAARPRTFHLIAAALRSSGLAVTEVIENALRKGEHAIEGIGEVGPEMYALVAVLRTLLAALVAREIGYEGSISGWEKHDPFYFFLPADSDWWHVAEETDAPTFFADVVTTKGRIDDLWPSFKMPVVPEEGPIAVLARFAEGLAAKTEGKVLATVQPMPTADPATRDYAFVLRAVALPSAQTTLFTMRPGKNGLKVIGWTTEALLKDVAEARRFARTIAKSDEAAARIERLLITAETLRA